MKSAVANAILGRPINWLQRAIDRQIRLIDVPYPAKIPRIAIVASVLYFGVAALAIGMAILLAIADTFGVYCFSKEEGAAVATARRPASRRCLTSCPFFKTTDAHNSETFQTSEERHWSGYCIA